MKANELMIGDWVTGKKWRENPSKLSRINDNGKYYYGITSDGTQVGPFLLEEIEPIPLTPEILEKNGFVKESGENHGDNLQYCILTDGLWIDISGENFFEGKLEYVHQLQQALRLCGISKETIEL